MSLLTPGASSTPPGFDPRYDSFVDYILKITEEIWEKRAIWLLYDTYADDVIVHSGVQSQQGRDAVIHGTLKTLSAFPDRRMKGEAVIWGQCPPLDQPTPVWQSNPEDVGSFFSSHRIASQATNLGRSSYGEATGKKIHFRTIADCFAWNNVIYREWLVRDNLTIVEQLGFDPVQLAKQDQRYRGVDPERYDDGCPGLEVGQDAPDPIALPLQLFQKVWMDRSHTSLDSYYQDDAPTFGICDTVARNSSERLELFDRLLHPFPHSRVKVDQCTCTAHADHDQVALRWRLLGTHQRQGGFGPPRGEEVNLLAISHYDVDRATLRIKNEWLVYDAFDLLCQLHRHAV